jgi:hypothetical protein
MPVTLALQALCVKASGHSFYVPAAASPSLSLSILASGLNLKLTSRPCLGLLWDGGNSRPTRMYFASCGFELCLNLDTEPEPPSHWQAASAANESQAQSRSNPGHA